MKRIVAIVVLLCVLCSFSSCRRDESQIERLFEGLKAYDRAVMSEVLTDFPNNSEYVYLDDIFNDEKYSVLKGNENSSEKIQALA